jgi:signal transduction histidine kinase/CheY-like chemotaxis protein/HPt (histidine-containing phosphotransfer) domain-containing protein
MAQSKKEIELVNSIIVNGYKASNDAFLIHDIKGNIVYFNNALQILVQLPAIKVKNLKTVFSYINKLKYENYFSYIKKHNNYSKNISSEIEGKHFKLSGNAVSNDGIKYFLLKIEDNTEQYELERGLASANQIAEIQNKRLIKALTDLEKASKAIQASSKAKEQLMANITHELRTPLNAVLGYSKLFQNTLLDNKQIEYIDAIKDAGNHLLGIINDILDVAKIESGELKLNFQAFDLKKSLSQYMNILKPRAEEKNIQLILDIKKLQHHFVVGDELRLSQILINLINNAIKFTTEGKVEIIVTSNIIKNKVISKIKVKDTGCGIEAEKLEHIFNRFYQVDSSNNRQYQGTGLGLSIVKQLVELHNGKVSIKSKVNVGTTFDVQIPFTRSSEEEVNKLEVEKSAFINVAPKGKIKVLIAEDNLLNAKMIVSTLLAEGYLPTHSKNGYEAIEQIKNEVFDIILMDIQMPGIDGYETTDIIRNTYNVQTPIIAMTAHSYDAEKERILKAKMEGYLPKPFEIKSLVKIINQHTLLLSTSDKTKKSELVNNNTRFELLNQLTDGDFQQNKEMIDIFLKESGKSLMQLEAVIQNQQFKEIKEIAHKLMTSFRWFNAKESADLLQKMETQRFTEMSTNKLIRDLDFIKKDHAAISSDLKAYLKDNQS